MTTLLLVHGGLWEEGVGAERFWRQPGIREPGGQPEIATATG